MAHETEPTISSEALRCEVFFAAADGSLICCTSQIFPETTIWQAIHASGILQQHTEIDLTCMRVGIYGKLKKLDDRVTAGDRIEIYRPLQADPKTSRRLRARKQQG